MLNFGFYILFIADKNLVVSHWKLHIRDIKFVTSVIIILLLNKLHKTRVKYLNSWIVHHCVYKY